MHHDALQMLWMMRLLSISQLLLTTYLATYQLFKKPEVNIKKSPLDRLLRPVSLAGDALVRIPNNDIIWSKSMKFHILEILAICENNRDYCHTFRTFGFAALRVLWFVGQFKRLTLNSSTETPIVRLRLKSSSSTCGKSLRSGFE